MLNAGHVMLSAGDVAEMKGRCRLHVTNWRYYVLTRYMMLLRMRHALMLRRR